MSKTHGIRLSVWICIPLLAFALGCGQSTETKKKDDPHGTKAEAPHKVPESYSEGVEQAEMHRDEIAELIKAGKLDEVHHHAEQIKKIADQLAMLASKSDSGIAQGDIKEINLTAKALAAKFDPIDAAADSGKKDETKKIYDEMVTLIETLKKFPKGKGGTK